MSLINIKDSFDLIEDTNKEVSSFSDFSKKVNYLKKILIIKKIIKGKYIYEFGCREGNGLEILKDFGYAVDGIDISDKSIEICKQKKLPAIRYDVNNLISPNNIYDFVFSIDFLDSTENPVEIIKKSIDLASNGSAHIVNSIDNLKNYKDELKKINCHKAIKKIDDDTILLLFNKKVFDKGASLMNINDEKFLELLENIDQSLKKQNTEDKENSQSPNSSFMKNLMKAEIKFEKVAEEIKNSKNIPEKVIKITNELTKIVLENNLKPEIVINLTKNLEVMKELCAKDVNLENEENQESEVNPENINVEEKNNEIEEKDNIEKTNENDNIKEFIEKSNEIITKSFDQFLSTIKEA